MRDADRGHVLDFGMSAENLLHFGRVDILPAGDDHVALAIGEKKVSARVTTGKVADRAVRASKRRGGLLRRLPIALERVGGTRIDFAHFAVGDLVAVRIQ